MKLYQIRDYLLDRCNGCPWIIWTGGEPIDQLTEEILTYFRDHGIKQAVETSGVKPFPRSWFDYISLSPKVAEHILARHFPEGVTELRYVRHSGQAIPKPAIKADYYFLSPHFDGFNLNQENVRHCLKLCLENPAWRLSLQVHKLLGIL